MAWLDVPFPKRIAMGVRCEPGWDVSVIGVLSGAESRNLNWQDARHEYDAAQAVGTETEYRIVLEHFHMARGMLHKFALKDPLDHDAEPDQGIVLQSDDSPPVLQLHKQYGAGSLSYERKITRLVPGSVQVFNSDVLADPGDYTLDDDTGEIVFAGGVAANLSWAGEFYVPVRYDINKLPARAVNRRGADGELLVSLDSLPLVEVRE